MNQEQAEIIALDALRYIAAEQKVCEAFVAQSGSSPDDLAAHAKDPDFLAGILDFLLSHEPTLLEFCAANNLEPTLPAAARRALPGGQWLE